MAVLWVLMCTAWMVFTGTQLILNVGDLARFGSVLFGILAPLQLAVVVFFSALSAASAVAQEKDRRTLVLLLMTRLSASELVLGKLLASLLHTLMVLAAALPLFMLMALFGGVTFEQILLSFAVTLASALAAGSLGSTMALWRDKTFQSLGLTALLLVFWIAGWEVVRLGFPESMLAGATAQVWAARMSPWAAVLEATQPSIGGGGVIAGFLITAGVIAVALNVLSIFRVRTWNTATETRRGEPEERAESIFSAEARAATRARGLPVGEGADKTAAGSSAADGLSPHAEAQKTRAVWDNPILWREMRTWAYGRKVLIIRFAYWFLFACCIAMLFYALQTGVTLNRNVLGLTGGAFIVLSLVLVNAQAVLSVTNERDGRALDILLVTDVTPKEFIFGKVGGAMYNTLEMVLLPIVLCGMLAYGEVISVESLAYLVIGLLVVVCFAAMLGIHSGMAYANSRTAVATSLGTMFFLFIGIYTCWRIMIAFGGSFHIQLAPFLAFMLGGGVGLYVALGIRNPSPAIMLASLMCPFATFYAITSFVLQQPLGVFLVVVFTYGFTTLAMLVPAVYEFDVATGRTTGGD